MTSSATITQSATTTVTEARVRVVMRKFLADLVAAAGAGLLDVARVQKWHDDMSFALIHGAAAKLQVKFQLPDGRWLALDYVVSDDGSLLEDSGSGGVDYHALPAGTKTSVTFGWRPGCSDATVKKVRAYFEERGWTFNGSLVEGDTARDRAYSKEGFGLVRNKVGNWP